MENGSYLKQASYVANPSYFKTYYMRWSAKCGSAKQHNSTTEIANATAASASRQLLMGKLLAGGKCLENMFGQLFPKYWYIGRTTMFVSNVTMLQHADFFQTYVQLCQRCCSLVGNWPGFTKHLISWYPNTSISTR